MFVSLQELERHAVDFKIDIPAGEIEYDGHLKQATPLHAEGVVELTNSAIGEIQIRGSLRVTVESACDRCLETASFPIQKEFALSYYPVEQFQGGGEDEIDEEESEIAYYDGGGLQLQDILREVVLLSAPMQFICSESCKGICPNCGQNRNQQDCQCQVQPVDDRWTQLKAIRIAPAPQ